MKIPVKLFSYQSLSLLLLGVGFTCGLTVDATAQQQRDPFQKPVVRVKNQKVTVGPTQKPKPAGPTAIPPAPIQARIENYRNIRRECAERNLPCPKPTSVLTLDEIQVTGIFRTPRGYAAMVEATPLVPKLSYTIYPGERFVDGQLVAIEDTKLIFRRVIKMTDGKGIKEVVTSTDKILRQETVNDLASSRPETPLQAAPPAATTPNPAPGAAAAAGAAAGNATAVPPSAPQMSSEAVPLAVQKTDAAANSTPAATTAATPDATDPAAAETTAPAKPKTKVKSKPKNNK